MVKVSIEKFLRTGEFGPVRLGDSREQVLAHLGEPDHQAKPGKKLPVMFWYGVFEFYFLGEGESLNCIYCDHFDSLYGSATMELDPWFLHGRVDRKIIEESLQSANIGYCLIPTLQNLSSLHTVGGVKLLFIDPESDDPSGLYSIGLEQPFETGPLKSKQISVTISLETYELIRREAQRTGVKMAKICSQWITERAKSPFDSGDDLLPGNESK